MNTIALAKRIERLSSMPEVVMRINEVLNSPQVNFADLKEIILHDPALTAQVLKIANRGADESIETISAAMLRLDKAALKQVMADIPIANQHPSIAMDDFWYHSVLTGILAKALARNFQSATSERLYIVGLLSGIGKLIMFDHDPEQRARIFTLPDAKPASIDYAELAAELLKYWQLPTAIWQPILYQCDPLQAKGFETDACWLLVALKIADAVRLSPDRQDGVTLQNLGISADVLGYLALTPEIIQTALSESVLSPWEILRIIRPSSLSIY